MKLKWPILPDTHNRYSSRHFDGRSLGNFGLHRRTAVKGQPDISLKCYDAFYPRFWSYNVFMSFPPPLSLHHYFVVAARMRHHFESNLVAVEEPRVAALQDPDLAAFELFSGPRGNFMYHWYASLYVVVRGFRNLRLIDPRIKRTPGVTECKGAPPVLEWRLSLSARLLFRDVARTHSISQLHRMGARVDGSFLRLLRSRNQAR